MQINLKSDNLELSDSIYEYVNKKIGELERFIPNTGEGPNNAGEHDTVQVDVEVGRTSNHHKKGDVYKAEVNMAVPGEKNVLRATSEQWDLHQAIDEVKEDMQRQLKKYKTKKSSSLKKGLRRVKRITRLSKLARRDDEEL